MGEATRRAVLKGGLTVTAAGALGLGSASTASAAVPQIHPTSEWNARPASGAIVVENHKPTYIVVHHTVDPGNNTDYSLAHALQISRDIQTFHMDTRGWIDTGQQFTNSRGGYVTEGRHRSLEILRGGTQHVQGANVGNHNSECLGIENEGLYSTVDVPVALWNSLVSLVAYIADQYGIAPSFIKGHRDFNSTECCGQVLYDRLPELRTAVSRVLGVAAPRADVPEWPLLKPGQAGPKVQTAQRFLRAAGYGVPVDGVFGRSTTDAVTRLAAAHGLSRASCTAARAADESGFLGSDVWPLIVPPGKAAAAWRTELAH
ncbi:N-acetylmuramoyl-L-alanine amidase [Amycolatopsis sp. FDAARGOS 1241]|uniref:peptidoglycan recognition protein family protein n=1 Tax=Amycolatopsis sp. FDAARGOS 1241 TaxID=2778070 RepID=UPI001951372D|nr:N-acetylmuramoyl-L-alanine amidase [Amycolatopsis sp. FDAARGOS 1241]QRP46620.1 N-acetylmuramoyl-L-alanine amidase [Amycolatopsis sp. FDAARGOS 1241]